MDDAELLRAMLDGDESAFTELVNRYHAALVRLARYYVGDDATAQDVVQDTWIAVLRGADRFEGRSSVKTWLFRICANRARTTATRRARVVPVPIGAEGSVDQSRFDEAGVWREPPVPFTDAVEFRADAAPLVAAVRAAITALPEPQSTVVTLRDVEGLSTEEVARLTGLTPGNVRVVLHRGRARVRAAVEQEYREATR